MPAPYNNISSAQGNKYGVRSRQSFRPEGQRVTSLSAATRSSSAYNIFNKDIAAGRNSPNSFSKQTAGTVYEGSIGNN